jgi:hypothetical protein
VEAAELPTATATAGDVWVSLDAQLGRLDVANAYKRAALETVERCEARDAATIKRLQRPWWKLWG